MKIIKLCSLLFLSVGCICFAKADTGVDGSATITSSLTMTGLLSVSSFTANTVSVSSTVIQGPGAVSNNTPIGNYLFASDTSSVHGSMIQGRRASDALHTELRLFTMGGTAVPVERLTIDDSGSVRVGSTTSDQNFYVTSSSGTEFRILASQDSAVWAQTQSNHPLVLTTNNGPDAIRVTTSQEVLQPNQPSFLVTAPSNTTDVTGDGTIYTAEYDTEIFDQGSDFNTGTYTFTAPVAGRYLFNASVLIQGVNSSQTSTGEMLLVTSNRTYDLQSVPDSSLARFGSQYIRLIGSVIADMDAGDTAVVQVAIFGGTKTCDLNNGATYNYFSGSLIN